MSFFAHPYFATQYMGYVERRLRLLDAVQNTGVVNWTFQWRLELHVRYFGGLRDVNVESSRWTRTHYRAGIPEARAMFISHGRDDNDLMRRTLCLALPMLNNARKRAGLGYVQS